jgi:hypothetical protein
MASRCADSSPIDSEMDLADESLCEREELGGVTVLDAALLYDGVSPS